MKKLKVLKSILFLLAVGIYGQQTTGVVPEEKIEVITVTSEQNSVQTPSKNKRGAVYYQQRKLDSDFKEEYKGKKFDYDRIVEERKPKEINAPAFRLPVGLLNALMYILLAFILGLVLYIVFKNAGGFSFGRSRQSIKVDTSEESDIEDIENLSIQNFAQLIQKAKAEGNYRKAIRFYYLWVLQKLADQKLIQYNKDKTDYEYYLELGQNPIREDFYQNTYIYDYVWYGKFEMNTQEFQLAESIFQRTLNRIK